MCLIRRFLCALAALAMLCGCAHAQEGAEMGEMVRLHVVAADDGARAQTLKL